MTTTYPAFDVVVIGGGIQGAGCVQAFAANGYRALLCEQHDFASATSSRSSKLVHGGLRYLESGQFQLVYKALRERRRLLRLAPSLVQLQPFYIPVYRGQRAGRWRLRAGLSLYSLLGGLHRDSRFRTLDRADWSQLEGIKTDKLQAVFQYWDAQTDDSALTRAVIRSAITLGAQCRSQCRFLGARPGPGSSDNTAAHHAWELSLESGGAEFAVTSKVIVNATGPWVEQSLQKIDAPLHKPPEPPPRIDLVRGSHIELEQPTRAIYYVASPRDGRPVFIMPWKGRTLVGTTEVAHQGDPRNPCASDDEVHYLQETLTHYFSAGRGLLCGSWAGLRVLPARNGHDKSGRPFSGRARDTVLHCDDRREPTVISLFGGKLTTYRQTAQAVVKLSQQALGKPRVLADTASLTLD